MEKKSIGGFIAALRKAAGMTQQQMADRLGVSNKAVSRWERDESAPDLSVIPEIAALFGVTCDELLRGARAPAREPLPAGASPAGTSPAGAVPTAENQVSRRSLSRFKSAVGIALGTAFTGLILHFAVSYGFYKPVVGFCILLIFAAASLILTFLARNRLEEQAAGGAAGREYRQTRFEYSFFSVFFNGMAILWCLPFILIRDAYFADSVIQFREYLKFVFPFACATAVIWLFSHRIGRRICLGEGRVFYLERRLLPFNLVQCAAILLVYVLVYAAAALLPAALRPAAVAALLLAAAVPVLFFVLRDRDNAGLILLTGLRNIGLLIALSAAAGAFSSYTVFNETGVTERGISYAPGTMALAACVFLLSAGGYTLLRRAARRASISGEI